MRTKLAIVVTFIGLLVINHTILAAPTNDFLYENETPVEFEANSGDITDAVAGYMYVPENRKQADSRTIRINYIRFPATAQNQGPPIVYLAGGPGGSGIGTAKWRRFPLFMALRKYGDVIALDQRGTGQSEQANACESTYQIFHSKAFKLEKYADHYRDAAKACFSSWQKQGVDVYGYTTEQNAWDINALRQHLQAEKITLWGISYGSHLALAALKLFPENIEKVIIASAEGLNQTVKLPSETDAFFQRVQTVIDQQALKEKVPDLPTLMRRVHAKLEAKPISLTIANQDGSESDILFQTMHLRALASMMIADPNEYLAMLIHTYYYLDIGDTDLLVNILQRGIFNDGPIRFSLMPLAMDVASGITEKRLTLFERQVKTSLLSDQLNFPMPLLNRIDARLDLGDEFRKWPASDVPTLLLSGSLDGRTYPNEQKAAVKGLKNIRHITVKNAGHNLFMSSPDVLTVMEDFLSGRPMSKADIQLPLPDLSLKQ